jgi:HEAT repeat protein
MQRFLTIAFIAMAVSLAAGTLSSARPPSQEEVHRRAAFLQELKASLAAEGSAADKLETITRLMAAETDPDIRRMVLDVAIQTKGLDFDSLLTKVLADDPDAGIRSRAATALGGLGTKDCFAALARAAAEDPTTEMRLGDIALTSSARRDAMFALAALVSRHPKLADKAADALRGLATPDGTKDPQSLADARIASLYQITRDEKLLRPFYERLRSKEAATRVRGVVAFQFCELRTAPPELTAAIDDDNAEVRSWAALVLGRIADPGTVPLLIAAAEDSTREIGVRCNAIHSLGRMRAVAAVETVRKLLKDDEAAVQSQAAIALYRITGEKVEPFPEGYNAD